MPSFNVNVHRRDPYKNFKFRVVLDGRIIPNVSRISPLQRSTAATHWRDGSVPSAIARSPGSTRFEPITMERGLTHDTTFEDWASECFSIEGDAAMSLRDFRKDLRIDLLNEQGSIVLSYMVFRCWVSEYQALPELDANSTAVALESITLQYEGFERDRAVKEPEET